jgi:hypothetical protein
MSGLTMGLCSYCGWAFCTECRRAWHGQSACGDLLSKFRDADEAGREALRKRCATRLGVAAADKSAWAARGAVDDRRTACYAS